MSKAVRRTQTKQTWERVYCLSLICLSQAWVNVTREAAEDETSPFILSLLARARAGLGAWFVRKAEAAPRTPQTLPERALARAGPAA